MVNQKNEPLPGATVHIQNTTQGVQTDVNGRFTLYASMTDEMTIVASFIGHQSMAKTVSARGHNSGRPLRLHFILKENTEKLDEVLVRGESRAARIERSGFAVTSVDTRHLQKKSAEINEVLDKTPGLRVRRNGGMGSHTQYNINGLSGSAVRIFIDGVPAESYGASYSVNSLPISLIERIDVYKGVVPIEFGNDAMGGAINIVTKQLKEGAGSNQALNVSYSHGSFNTHRADVNGSWQEVKSGLTTRFSTFYNASDNNYFVWSDDIKIKDYNEFLPDGSRNPEFLTIIDQGVKVRRFNDGYESYGAKVDLGLSGRKWADQLFLSINASEDYKESQHGPRMISPYGERFTESWTLAPAVIYVKNNALFEGLDVSMNVQYAVSERATVDTTTNRYDWFGNLIPHVGGVTRLPGEGRNASLNVNNNRNYVARASVSYAFLENHMLGLNYSNNYFIRSSDDELRAVELRNYGSENRVNKQITGLTYQNTFFNEKLKHSIFVKHYYNHLKQDRMEYANGVLDTIRYSRPDDNWGYGATSSFALTPAVRFNASVEQAVRLVTANEVFGNVSDEIVESSNLEPEKSLNVNLGGMFTLYKTNSNELKLNTSFFFRDTYDRIKRSIVVRGDDSYSVFNNIGHIISRGVEAQLDYRMGVQWHFMLQGYYLDSRFMEKYTQNGSENLNYQSREPNMPYLTFGGSAEYNKEHLFKQGDRISFNWYTSFINEFHFDWSIIGSQNKPIVPHQFLNDVSVSYVFPGERLTLSLDGKNILNELSFDNFAIQRPGRTLSAKMLMPFFNSSQLIIVRYWFDLLT
ncbi:TonB-dependent receptor [Geofilum rubicundum]|uniref:TonB-dependent receptor n=1 Tax=Geofilum rubicundum JCM 15548 TaxID=1236989 RepID=A0A0E9M2I2_9BACT|nr:TonB-dependent receptor [Geofilum rubicundum]GAO31591.1 TonB-dependent receptor [Geofilum rubicundum JCM 15548]